MSEETFKAQRNKQDPLRKTEEARRVLFTRFSEAANSFPQRDVTYAAANLIINSVRQQCKTQRAAELMIEEVFAHTKRVLLEEHYFPAGGRRNVYPYKQVIGMDLVRMRK